MGLSQYQELKEQTAKIVGEVEEDVLEEASQSRIRLELGRLGVEAAGASARQRREAIARLIGRQVD